MKLARPIAVVVMVVLLPSCSTTTLPMVETRRDQKTGKTETRTYSRFYNAAEWVEEGKLGLEVWIDHEKEVVPALRSIQQATGALGPDDLRATGLITLYFVNLVETGKSVTVAAIATARKDPVSSLPPPTQLRPRSRARLVAGRVPIGNYATAVDLVIEYSVNGIAQTRALKLQRLTEAQAQQYFAGPGVPPYPWFKAPYFPFKPPLARQD